MVPMFPAAASDRPEAGLAGSVSAWADVLDLRRRERAWVVTSVRRRCRPRPATGSNPIQGLSPRSYVTRHRPRLQFQACDADRSDTAAG